LILAAAGDGGRNWSSRKLPSIEAEPGGGWWGLERRRMPDSRRGRMAAQSVAVALRCRRGDVVAVMGAEGVQLHLKERC